MYVKSELPFLVYVISVVVFVFFNDTATTEIYTLSLHDALPISSRLCPPYGSMLRLAPSRPGIGDAEEGLQHAAIGAQGGTVALVHDRATLEDHGAVGDAQDLVRILLDQDGGEALLAHDAGERRDQLLDDDRREAFERLVEQDHARVEH